MIGYIRFMDMLRRIHQAFLLQRANLFVLQSLRMPTFCMILLLGILLLGYSCFLNQTPIDWFSKHQNTVKTATHGSEFTAAWILTDLIVDLHCTLRSLGVPLDEPAWMFGDNESVVTSSTKVH